MSSALGEEGGGGAPGSRAGTLLQPVFRWLGDPRLFLPVLLLVCSRWTPLIVIAFHHRMSTGVQNLLFFWPQYGLYPYASYFRILREGGYGGNPLGLPGILTSAVHWTAVVWLTRRVTARLPLWASLGVFAVVALLSLVGVHVLLPLVGFEQQLDGP